MTNSDKGPENAIDTRLWCLHHIGSDDVHPAPNFDTAQRWANYANKRLVPGFEDISRFVVAVWPWSADSHAGSLDRSIADWSLPDGSPVVDPAEGLIWELLEALRDLENYLRLTPHHNAPEAAAARKVIAKAEPKP